MIAEISTVNYIIEINGKHVTKSNSSMSQEVLTLRINSNVRKNLS